MLIQAKASIPERPISLNTFLKIQAYCADCLNLMTGSYNHADKSGQLLKTEPLRLRYSSL